MKQTEFFAKEVEKEIQYILTSTTEGHVLNKPNTPEYDRTLERLFKSINRSIRKGKELKGVTPKEKIRNTVHYRLAEICKSAASGDEFSKMVKTFLPETTYWKNPNLLLKLGGFQWKTNFEIYKRAKKLKPPVEKEVVFLKDFHDKILNLERRIERIETLMKEMIKHKHLLSDKIMGTTGEPIIVAISPIELAVHKITE